MEIERIKHRIYTLDGIPAFKAGEWPGSVSNHWSEIGKRILVPKCKENILLGSCDNKPFHPGKKHCEPQLSKEQTFLSGVKSLKDIYQKHDK